MRYLVTGGGGFLGSHLCDRLIDGNDSRVVANVIVHALKGENIPIYGDGSQTRSFCYVADLIEAFIRFMDRDNCGPGPLNLGNPAEITIRDLADLVKEMTGTRSKIKERPLPEDDPVQRCPDISKAKELLDREPRVALREGLAKIISYFDNMFTRAKTFA